MPHAILDLDVPPLQRYRVSQEPTTSGPDHFGVFAPGEVWNNSLENWPHVGTRQQRHRVDTAGEKEKAMASRKNRPGDPTQEEGSEQQIGGPWRGDTLPWNLSRHQRIKRSKSTSGEVLDPAERAVIRIAGGTPRHRIRSLRDT
ncbi:unnamed protein product [Tetraodon nigroviridis]|uniref:(spotted green pufferfish) hypothetical protein n=1 Tax=Tetraodon nigroviridis TaxID=99883 RepID=Q4RUL0_TETNG|nr:unnamed protein product [Tetraodon nigroviridis]